MVLPRGVPVLSAIVLAGCLGPAPGAGMTEALLGDPALALVVDHDHHDLAEHAVSSNVRLLDRNGLVPYGTPSGAHAVDLNGDVLAVAMYAVSGEGERGFALFDVSDAKKPALLGKYLDPRATGGDRQLMFSADGKTVFQAAEPTSDAPSPVSTLDIVGGREWLILAVDVTDPASPTLVAEAPIPPFGPHTVFAAEVGGVQYVYVVSYGLQVWSYDAATGFTFEGRYASGTPGQLTQVPDGPQGQRTYVNRAIYGHDAFVWQDPVTDQHIAFVAYAYDGFKIVDLSDPKAPKLLSSWVPEGPDAPSYVHTVTVRMMGERRIAAVGAESFESRNRDIPSPVWFLDVTDLAKPELLATWTNPAGVGSNDLLFSAHDMRFDEHSGRTVLWLAHYHGGVWALDATDPAAPEVLGFYLPHEDQGYVPPEDCCIGLRMGGTPTTFDVIARDGVAYAADMWSGLYTIELADAPGT